MTEADRRRSPPTRPDSTTRVAGRGRSRRERVVRSLRRSGAASVARRAMARGRGFAHRLTAADGRVQRLRGRGTLALRAAPARGGAIRAHDSVVARVAALPAPDPVDPGAAGTARSAVSVVLVDARRAAVPARYEGAAEVVAVVPELQESTAAAAARGAQLARGNRICFLLASSEPLDASLIARLDAAVAGATVAASALLVHPVRPRSHATPHDGLTRQRGLRLDVDRDVAVVTAVGAGEPADPSAPTAQITGASAACVLIDRAAYEAAGGLPDYADLDVAMFELSRRLRTRGGEVVVVPAAVVVDHRPVPSAASLTRPIRRDDPAWLALVDDAGPALLREAAPLAPPRTRVAVTTAPPSMKVAARWGDWHFAQAFAAALRRAGHDVRVQTADAADDPAGRSCDVHCVVRGLHPVRRTRGQRHVLWIISHPETVDDAELDAADLVLVASHRFADAARSRTRTPVEVMLQATDPARFHPMPSDPEHRHDVVVVAKSRDQYRSAVADAIASGLRPAIFGSGWEPFVDPDLIVADYVDNAELPVVYASAGVLLNDHWDTMRDWGFVSNRIFDALACGTPVISDDVAEVDTLFEGAVPTFGDAAGLRRLVDEILGDPDAARARARRGRDIVLAHHTFDLRATEFLATLARHGLDHPPG